jgi:hypothetical protein
MNMLRTRAIAQRRSNIMTILFFVAWIVLLGLVSFFIFGKLSLDIPFLILLWSLPLFVY